VTTRALRNWKCRSCRMSPPTRPAGSDYDEIVTPMFAGRTISNQRFSAHIQECHEADSAAASGRLSALT
jgi:hypothetical protein